jgi:cytochrome c biogenesis protein CcdA
MVKMLFQEWSDLSKPFFVPILSSLFLLSPCTFPLVPFPLYLSPCTFPLSPFTWYEFFCLI